MFSQSFFQSLLELNELDLYRNQENDKYFDTFIGSFDEIPYDDMLKLFKSLFLPATILKLFENTYKLIDYIQTNTVQRDKILKLKKDRLDYLTPIINNLERKCREAQLEGNALKYKKLSLALSVHQNFLNDPIATLHEFQKAEIFLFRNRKNIHKLEYMDKSRKKFKEAQNKIDWYEQVSAIGKFYEGYEFFSKTYQKRLWHSTAIKIYKLCKLLNPNLIDNVLKEKVVYLFAQADISITLNTTRLNNADLFIMLNNIPIWAYAPYLNKRRLSIEIQSERAISFINKEKQNTNVKSPYAKLLENTPLALFLLF